MGKLQIGKLRGLQQLATPDGFFVICAIDHRGSFQKMIEEDLNIALDYKEMVEYKIELCLSVAPYASGVLLDPIYGAAQCIASGALPGNLGLLVSIEATGYEDTSKGRLTTLLEGWDVAKIKKMGASAVKMLVYYRPDIKDLAEKQLETVNKVAKDCIKHDIPFLVEPVSYSIGKNKPLTSDQKAEFAIETAKQMTALPIDVLKAEFPGYLSGKANKEKLLLDCCKLDEASQKPWVILSAGVDYDTFREQVRIACQAGASGFLGGRAIWQEALKYPDAADRMEYLNTTVADRLKDLCEITVKYGTPWHKKMNMAEGMAKQLTENWYQKY
jgi:tagatose 1,6-diphosphate aldolase